MDDLAGVDTAIVIRYTATCQGFEVKAAGWDDAECASPLTQHVGLALSCQQSDSSVQCDDDVQVSRPVAR